MDIAVLSGAKYSDIDAYACAISYAKLLSLSGFNSQPFLAPLNYSIPKIVKSLGATYYKLDSFNDYPKRGFVLVDVSDPNYFPDFVHEPDVIEVWDHRLGYEEYWRDLIGDKSFIEPVGACATLIYERANRLNSLDPITASLLQTAILSNTLNFNSYVTTDRDKKAYKELSVLSKLSDNWPYIYFGSVQNFISQLPLNELVKKDSKFMSFGPFKKVFIFQLELYSAYDYIKNIGYDNLIKEVKKQAKNHSFLITIPSISDKHNIVFTSNSKIKDFLIKHFGVVFNNNVMGFSSRIFLRKELLMISR